MGRDNILVQQPATEPVDVANWRADEEFEVYPEGARVKRLLWSPKPSAHAFLVPNHRYLFKEANSRYPDQFWMEVIAYRVGCQLGVTVPPAFVAWDSRSNKCGALIEWFLDYPGEPHKQQYIPGGDYMTHRIPGYDRKKGRQHNVESIIELMEKFTSERRLSGNWRTWWCDAFLFDAMIGNTDRHQDNWGLLWTTYDGAPMGEGRMAPLFDNGTSLGHEIFPEKRRCYSEPMWLNQYIGRGTHHARWKISDTQGAQHASMIKQFYELDEHLREHVKNRLSAFNISAIRSMLDEMQACSILIPLTNARAALACHLIEARHQLLIRTTET